MSDFQSNQEDTPQAVDASAKRAKIYTLVVRGFCILFLVFVLVLPAYIYSVSTNFLGLFGEMPNLKAIENPENDLSSELYSADGALLGKYFRENRSPVTYEELSPNLVNALLATEDYRFTQHSGIDLRSMLRVAFGILTFNTKGGGSTLSQQTAKNLFKTRSRDADISDGHLLGINKYVNLVIQKTKEWILAVRLEKYYTKKEILALYLNTAEFGSNAYGIKVAAKTFFNKQTHELSVEEAATLVGLLKATHFYSPVYNPENSLSRRNLVMYQMEKYNFLPQAEYDSIKQLPIALEYKVDNHNEGMATYFRSVIQKFLLQWTNEHGYDLYEDGLKIYTTLDSRMQEYAEKAVTNHMKELQRLFNEHWKGQGDPWRDEKGRVISSFIPNLAKRSPRYRGLEKKYGKDADSIDIVMNTPVPMTVFSWNGEIDTTMSPIDSIKYDQHFLHTGFMAMDPHNGQIKAWVGGINHKFFKYDHVMQGKRQPGSTFKPFVYATAIDNGYSPCYEVVDAPISIPVIMNGKEDIYQPQNSNGKFSGESMTLRHAMATSTNSITVFMMNKIGPATVVDYAHRLGIESPLEPVLALSLGGGGDVSVYEMVGAYSAFANKGTWTEPIYITRIEDKNGNIIQEFTPKTREALSEETAYIMLHMLKGTVEEVGGTANRRLPDSLKIDNEIGAKTGTTSNFSDGWFMGVTKDLVAGAWVGGDNRSIHFRNIILGQGAVMALPIWSNFMKDVYNDDRLDIKRGAFEKPARRLSVELDCDKYGDTDEADSLYTEKKDAVITKDDIF